MKNKVLLRTIATIMFVTGVLLIIPSKPVAAQEVTAVVLPNPVGLIEILFVLGLCGFALWKTTYIRMTLSVCIIIWGVFAIPYDIKIAAPLVVVGTILFFMALFQVTDLGTKVREIVRR